jgi:serine/threonine protein kinase/Flp pilus assembly protein TadD
MPESSTVTDTLAGFRLSLPANYQLRANLGEGGFGAVVEAWDDKLRRSVAIKRLRHVEGPAHSARLVQEARLAASLQHAAFVKIYALEEGPDSQSIVMELVRGQTLKQAMAQASPEQRQALAIVRQIAEAMCEAHDSGLVHGDLKPSNVMLEPSGTVRILDFGLAVQADPQATTSLLQTDPQGTIAYMAPERLLGGAPKPQSDIYALGVMLYELLAGARPFADLSGLALAAAHMQSSSDQWPYPETLPPPLVQLVRAMTATPAERRLASMRQVCERLAQLDGTVASIGPAGAMPVLGIRLPWPRRHVRGLAAAVVMLCLLGGAWLAAPHLPTLAQLVETARPYSEAQEMQHGLQALSIWDRPGSLNDAGQRFSRVLEHNADNAAAVAGMAMTYALRHATDDQDEVWLRMGAAAAQRALSLNAQLALSHVAQGDVLSEEGKQELALAAFERALVLDPGNLFALKGRVGALRQLRRYDEALHAAELNLLRFPSERIFADQIGTIHYVQAHYQEAEQAFRRSIQIQPDSVLAYANLSAVLASRNRPDEALHVLQQGLQVRPSAWLYGNLGNVLFLKADYLGAVGAFEAAVAPDKGNPADYLGWANLADTLLWIPGRAGEARRAYLRAAELLAPRLARAPDDVTLASRMGLYFARTGDKPRCLALLRHALALAPANPSVQFRAGLAFELVGERHAALGALALAVRQGYPVKLLESTPELMALRRDPAYLR